MDVARFAAWRRVATALGCLVAMLAVAIGHVGAQEPTKPARRLALVVGNQDYLNVTKLATSRNDAEAIAKKLREKGYTVQKALDLPRSAMFDTMEGFIKNVVRKGDEVVIYYAGHGIELAGSNFLLPVDIADLAPDSVRSLEREAISVSNMMELIERQQARATIVIIDACRNNPLRPSKLAGLARSVSPASRGLGAVTAAQGSYVMYSAGIGEQALDRLSNDDPDPNGLYTRNLLKLMDREGLEIDELNEQLVQAVQTAALTVRDADDSPHRQRPATYDSLSGKFYFTAPKPVVTVTACERLTQPDAAPEVVRLGNASRAVSACEGAMKEFPLNGRFADLFLVAEEQLAFQKAAGATSIETARLYLQRYPNGRFKREIEQRIASLGPVVDTPKPVAPVIPVAPASKPVAPPVAGDVTSPNAADPAPPAEVMIQVPEGLTSLQIVELLRKQPELSGDLKGTPDEGSLLPGPQSVARGASRQNLLDLMKQRRDQAVAEIWAARDPAVTLRSPDELVALASLIEKDTRVAADRPRIAAVYLNRLKGGMRLQSDATVIYGLVGGRGELGRALARDDIQSRNPYNTYVVQGLPAGPIVNPGRQALEAAARPAKTDDLYFVSDGAGGHAFAATLAEHNKNVARWREIEKVSRLSFDPPPVDDQQSDKKRARPKPAPVTAKAVVKCTDFRGERACARR